MQILEQCQYNLLEVQSHTCLYGSLTLQSTAATGIMDFRVQNVPRVHPSSYTGSMLQIHRCYELTLVDNKIALSPIPLETMDGKTACDFSMTVYYDRLLNTNVEY